MSFDTNHLVRRMIEGSTPHRHDIGAAVGTKRHDRSGEERSWSKLVPSAPSRRRGRFVGD
jgi:hypothetical protein